MLDLVIWVGFAEPEHLHAFVHHRTNAVTEKCQTCYVASCLCQTRWVSYADSAPWFESVCIACGKPGTPPSTSAAEYALLGCCRRAINLMHKVSTP